MVFLPLVLSTVLPAFCQSLQRPSFGVEVGVPLTSDFQPDTLPSLPYAGEVTRKLDFPFLTGIVVAIPAGEHLSVEVDGLYRRLRYPDDPSVVVTWEMPVLAKYRIASKVPGLFVEGGPSFRFTGNLNASNPSHYGVSVGVGAGFNVAWLRIEPAIRYTHWAADGRPPAFPPTLTRVNQVEKGGGLFVLNGPRDALLLPLAGEFADDPAL